MKMNIIRGLFSPTRRVLASPITLNTLLPKKKWEADVGRVTLVDSNNNEVVVLGNFLGSGSYGNVYGGIVTARNNDGTNTVIPVAVKIGRASPEIFAHSELPETGAYIHLSMDPKCSPLVTCVYAVFVTKMDPDPVDDKWRYGIIMERMDGDLFRLAKRIRDKEAPDVNSKYKWLMHIAFYMIYALNYLHTNGWAHNDVKPENFLYRWPAGEALPKIKLADLGFACSNTITETAQTALLNYVIDQYMYATGFAPHAFLRSGVNTTCRYSTTPFYQAPHWDPFSKSPDPTPDISDNLRNDRHEFAMAIKVLFLHMGFDYADVVRHETGQEAIIAWSALAPNDPEEYLDRRSEIRVSDLPYKFLAPPMFGLGHEFADTLALLSSNLMSTEAGMQSIADIYSRAKRI